MTNIILISNGSRPRLLAQTLETLALYTPPEQYNLTIVWDGINNGYIIPERSTVISMVPACNIVGRLKNLGAYWSEKTFGRGEHICFLDDDMALFPGWLETMIPWLGAVSIIGGVRHPYHGVNSIICSQSHSSYIEVTDAVAGYCHLMTWKTWETMGPYDAHAKGTGQSEDWKLCNDIVKLGGQVGYIHPPTMSHCGVTDSLGRPAVGMDKIERARGVIYE